MEFKRVQIYFFLALFALALAVSFFIFRPFLGLLLFAGALAILVSPVHRILTRFFRGNRAFGAFSTVILTLIVLVMPLAFLTVSLVSEAVGLFSRLKTQISFGQVEETLSRLLGSDLAHRVAEEAARAVANLADYVQPVFSSLATNVITLFSNTMELLLGALLLLISLYYILKDGPELKRQMLELSPLSDSDDRALYARVRDAVRAVAIGGFSVAITKGLIGGLLFLVLGLQAPIFWGTMIAMSNFVPGVGTAAITIPFAVYLFATGQFWQGLIFSLVSLVIIGLVDNFLSPQIIKSRIHIHPLLILLSILGGLLFFGAAGVFFGPVALSVTLALLDIYRKEFRQYLSASGE